MQRIVDALKNITGSQYWAVGRHVITLAGGVILTMAIFNAQDAGALVDALKIALEAVREIVVQLGVIAAAIGTVMTIVGPLIAGHSASPKSQIESVAANPQVKEVVVTTEAVAQSIPSEKVISK